MEKLELKHLVRYLPYGLKVKLDSELFPTPTLIGAVRTNCYLNYHGHGLCFEIDKIKPILRPLSDLTKEIEVNGEKFAPCEELNKIHKTTITYLKMQEIIIDNIKIDCTPSWIQNKLLEWHFDIYGLIEKGLAIDINTLNK